MRILIISNGVTGGGAENFAWNQASALRRRGHGVRMVSVSTSKLDRAVDYPIPETGLGNKKMVADASIPEKVAFFGRIFWNHDAYKAVRDSIADFEPDVIHLHRVRVFSVSLLHALCSFKGKVIMTLHDHYLTCPSSTRTFGDGRACNIDRCRPSIALKERCVGNSLVHTAVSLAEFSFRAKISRAHSRIDHFTFPSNFLLDWTVRSLGKSSDQMRYLPNFSPDNRGVPLEKAPRGDCLPFIFVGRLSEEKGLDVLLSAAALVPQAKVLVVGEGPLKEEIERRIVELGIANVELLGVRHSDELARLVSGSRALVVPSTCFETAPLVIIEAYQRGIPVIGARRGGISEMIVDGKTGYLFEAGNPAALADCMRRLVRNAELSGELGKNAQAWGQKFGEEEHLEALLRVYGA